jgi:hypothetical protein
LFSQCKIRVSTVSRGETSLLIFLPSIFLPRAFSPLPLCVFAPLRLCVAPPFDHIRVNPSKSE